MQRLISWGAGELGGRVIEGWLAAGSGPALAFTRTTDKHAALREGGAEPFTGSPRDHIEGEDALLISLPGSPRQLEAVEALAEIAPPARAVLVSTTGYYGGARGAVRVDDPPGDTERAQVAAEAEAAFRRWAGDRGVIVRFGGLYRLGKGPVGPLARRGAPPEGPEGKTLALIHYEDAAAALLAALRHPSPAPIYVAVTPPCPTRGEFYRLACARLGLAPPSFNDEAWPPAVYDVEPLRRDLLPTPTWPDWRAATTRS